MENVLGNRYGRWIVINNNPSIRTKKRRSVICQCSCKKKTVREVTIVDLKMGKSNSCGCLQRERAAESNSTHGLYRHPLYNIWGLMMGRCYNKNGVQYKDWGGRGIIVCDEWKYNPELFIEWCLENGWVQGLEIDRENNDGNYEPNNCRFVTSQINIINMRLIQSNNTSGYRGVYYNKRKRSYCCQIGYNKKYILSESGFKTPEQAAKARDIFIIKNDLPHKLNFPELAINGPL
ncbi:MAG: hypothetical protein WC055_00330 [Melioribacteraceae bacterium]